LPDIKIGTGFYIFEKYKRLLSQIDRDSEFAGKALYFVFLFIGSNE